MSFVLLGSSLFHSYQLANFPDLYVKSPSIHIEIISMLLVLVFNMFNFIMIIVSTIRKRTKAVNYGVLVGFISFILLVISLYIDAPTLLYMT
jgi:hypothetical protein